MDAPIKLAFTLLCHVDPATPSNGVVSLEFLTVHGIACVCSSDIKCVRFYVKMQPGSCIVFVSFLAHARVDIDESISREDGSSSLLVLEGVPSWPWLRKKPKIEIVLRVTSLL